MKNELLKLLYRSFDETLSKAEQEKLDQALAASTTLQNEKKQITAMRKLLNETAARSFKPFFSKRVMQGIAAQRQTTEDFFSSLLWSFRLVGVTAAIAVILLFANNVFKNQEVSLDAAFSMPKLTLEETWELNILVEEEQ